MDRRAATSSCSSGDSSSDEVCEQPPHRAQASAVPKLHSISGLSSTNHQESVVVPPLMMLGSLHAEEQHFRKRAVPLSARSRLAIAGKVSELVSSLQRKCNSKRVVARLPMPTQQEEFIPGTILRTLRPVKEFLEKAPHLGPDHQKIAVTKKNQDSCEKHSPEVPARPKIRSIQGKPVPFIPPLTRISTSSEEEGSNFSSDEELRAETPHGCGSSCISTRLPQLSERLHSDYLTPAPLKTKESHLEQVTLSQPKCVLVCTAAGTVCGSFVGILVGSVAGIVPSLVTLGLSIPINVGFCSVAGACVGTALAGSSTALHTPRLDLIYHRQLSKSGTDQNKDRIQSKDVLLGFIIQPEETGQEQNETSSLGHKIISIGQMAIAGSLITGSVTAVGGSAAGGFVGAAVGVLPACLTFGLSIPLGAIVGSSVGLCVGSVAGGTMGFVTGAVAGHSSWKRKLRCLNSMDGLAFTDRTNVTQP